MDSENEFYIYEWFNIDTGEVFYVGKGKKYRYKNKSQRNQYFKNYINKHKCDVRKVFINLSEQEAFDREIKLIKSYKDIGQCKCNLSLGGEGCTFEKGSKEDLIKKLNFIHNIDHYADDMDNEEEYDNNNLHEKSKEELELMYNQYKEYRENMKEYNNFIQDFPEFNENNKLDGYELMMRDKEIRILTSNLCEYVACKNIKFKQFKHLKDENDFILANFEWCELFSELFKNIEYVYLLYNTILYIVKFMKSLNLTTNTIIKIWSYKIIDNNLCIRFNTSDDKKMKRVKINIYDLILDFLIYKDINLFTLVYREIIVAPFEQ